MCPIAERIELARAVGMAWTVFDRVLIDPESVSLCLYGEFGFDIKAGGDNGNRVQEAPSRDPLAREEVSGLDSEK